MTPQNPTSRLWAASTADSRILVPAASNVNRGGAGHGSMRMGVATARGGEGKRREVRVCMRCAPKEGGEGLGREKTEQDKTLEATWGCDRALPAGDGGRRRLQETATGCENKSGFVASAEHA